MDIDSKIKKDLLDLLSDLNEEWDIEVLQLITMSIEDNFKNHIGRQQAIRTLKVSYNYSNLSTMRLRLIKDALSLW